MANPEFMQRAVSDHDIAAWTWRGSCSGRCFMHQCLIIMGCQPHWYHVIYYRTVMRPALTVISMAARPSLSLLDAYRSAGQHVRCLPACCWSCNSRPACHTLSTRMKLITHAESACCTYMKHSYFSHQATSSHPVTGPTVFVTASHY